MDRINEGGQTAVSKPRKARRKKAKSVTGDFKVRPRLINLFSFFFFPIHNSPRWITKLIIMIYVITTNDNAGKGNGESMWRIPQGYAEMCRTSSSSSRTTGNDLITGLFRGVDSKPKRTWYADATTIALYGAQLSRTNRGR